LLYLSQTDVKAAIGMAEAIEIMAGAFRELSADRVTTAQRTHLQTADETGHFLTMPVYAPQQGQFAVKSVTVFPTNSSRQMPTIHAMVLLFDGKTGHPLALMDGESVTTLRTGAASGLATRLLANNEATVAAIIGAGAQAATQLEAMAAVRPISKCLVFNRTKSKGEAFAKTMAERLGLQVSSVDSADALSQADILCTATSGKTPCFGARHLKAGVHINAVGSFRPDMQEVPGDVVASAKLVVDQRKACLEEAGDVIIPIGKGQITADHIRAELGELVDTPELGRQNRQEVTMFKSVGHGIQDLAVASHVYRKALELGLGTVLPS